MTLRAALRTLLAEKARIILALSAGALLITAAVTFG